MPTKFDFLSPGVQLREIDQSQVPETPENPGILLIGRARSGPAMKPIKVKNLNDFTDIFGLPIDGVRQADPWRQGNTGAPNYAAYAAQAYLAAGVGPVQYVRLLGKSSPTDTAGWSLGSTFGSAALTADAAGSGSARVPGNKAAYGLFIVPSGSGDGTGEVAASMATAIDTTGELTGDIINITVPVAAGGPGAIHIELDNDSGFPGAAVAGKIYINRDRAAGANADDASVAALIAIAFAGTDPAGTLPNGNTAVTADILYAASGVGMSGYTSGLTAVRATNAISLTAVTLGSVGNTIEMETGVGGIAPSPGFFTGGEDTQSVTGALAAILYNKASAFGISGSWVSGSVALGSPSSLSGSTLMNGNGASYGVKLGLSGSDGQEYFNVNFGGYSDASYIRNVLNTDPTKLENNLNYGETDVNYFLGETFDVNVNRLAGAGASADTYYFIAGLGDAGTANYDDYDQEMQAGKSSWFIGSRPSQKYLFRLVALDDGEEFQNNYYCRIANIKLATVLSPSAAFTLQIVKRANNINNDVIAEEYTNLNLNPDSENYIVKRIGDLNQTWNADLGKFTETGIYPNLSNYVRVEMATNSDVNAADCPIGFLGPAAPATVTITSDTAAAANSGSLWIHGSSSIALGNNVEAGAGKFIAGFPSEEPGSAYCNLTCSIPWPTFGMTTAGSLIGSGEYPFSTYFGLRHVKSDSLAHDKSFQDVARRRAKIDPDLAEGAAFSNASFVFTLEDIRSASAGGTTYYWDSGSYTNTGDDVSVAGDERVGLAGSTGMIQAKKIKQFAVPFFGGADGVDKRFADPFSNNRLTTSTNYPHFTVNQAIEMVEDPEQVEYELVSMPGMIKVSLVDKIVNQTTERGDALAIIDLKGIAQDKTDAGGTAVTAIQSTLINQLNTQYIDSSYAATYFPNVRLRDTMNGNGTILAAPPSVAGIGAIAQSEAASQPWFAPAGFNRGGLARLGGTAGPQVVGTVLHLTKDNRDVLYEAQVNPIARFPATGDTVIFGQKTLQQEMSALDRINVRRLMIYLKRHIGMIADTILFDQNVRTTWLRFKSRADAVLSQVQAELGIVEYKLVLDETTTTADLIDRNIMYAKVFIKPARSIEFIAVDFIITRSGVEF